MITPHQLHQKWIRSLGLIVGTALFSAGSLAAESEHYKVRELKVTILSTMLADSRGLGEWGFAALVEADGYSILYDTGYRPLPGSIDSGDEPHYRTINWGDFRQARADGDFADYGHELQIADFRRI
jgi:hypothetical protein